MSPIRKALRLWRGQVGELLYLFKSYAPPSVIFHFAFEILHGRRLRSPYAQAQEEFKSLSSTLALSDDWFTGNVPYWLLTFQDYKFREKEDLRALEIGSWEGLSSFFLLHSLPNARITCVDTWQGADEHRSSGASKQKALAKIEQSFDTNLKQFGNRVVKYRGTSFSYFNENTSKNSYDFIYVDGSHHCDDVIVDAIKSFELLKIGGIMIFDDYLWRWYPRDIDNPASPINMFLRLKSGCYKVVRVYSQLIIEKTADHHEAAFQTSGN